MDIFLIDQTAPFAVSILVFLGLFVVELLLLVFGASFSGAVDDMLPDFDFDTADFSVGKAISFVGFGRVPTLMVLMVFLVMFGIVGLGAQSSFHDVFGSYAPVWIASAIALPLALMLTGFTSKVLARLLPNVQTSAVADAMLIGRGATVTYGNATAHLPAAAEVRDEHGKLHHIQVKSDSEDSVLAEGQLVFISGADGGFYFASSDKDINANKKAI